MSFIDLGSAPDLSDAVSCKTSNKTVSIKTVWKLKVIPLVFYGVGNRPNWLDACRHLGMITSDVRPKDLYMGFKDVVNARAIVAGMRESDAKSQLHETLNGVGKMIRARAEKCVDLIIDREPVCTHALVHGRAILLYPKTGGRSKLEAEQYERKLERAIEELGPKWAQRAEELRSAMIAGRSTDPEDATQRWSRPGFPGFFEVPSDFYPPSGRQ